MEEGKVRVWYDKSVDMFCMLFGRGTSSKVIIILESLYARGMLELMLYACWERNLNIPYLFMETCKI